MQGVVWNTAAHRRSWRRRALEVWQRNRDILGNATSLYATTAVTSLLGFAFWALAAHMFNQRAVGLGSAAVSAMTVLGTIGMAGLNTVLIGELPRRKTRAGLISAALLVSFSVSFGLGVCFVLIAPKLSSHFNGINGTSFDTTSFAIGVGLIGASLVFDQATIGLLRGKLQLWRNVVFSASKLALLPAVTILFRNQSGIGIALIWAAGAALSFGVIAFQLWFMGDPVLPRPDWGVMRGLGRLTMIHNWLNLAITVPWLLLPVLVTVVVSPAANAAFYAAWVLSGFLRIVPTHLSTVLFAVAAAEPEQIAPKLRFSLRACATIGVPGIALIELGAHTALGLFGASYAGAATVALWVLVLGYVPSIPKVHYIAVCRATGHITRAAVVLSLTAVLELVSAIVGAKVGGLNGLSLCLLGAFIVEGVVTTPRVLRAVRSGPGELGARRRGGKHRRT